MIESGFRKDDVLQINTKLARNPKMWENVIISDTMKKILDAIDRGSIQNKFIVLRDVPYIRDNMEYYNMLSEKPVGVSDGIWTWNSKCFSKKVPSLFIEDDIFSI